MQRNPKKVARVLWIALAANIFVSLTKFGFGYAFSVLSMIADAAHSLADSGGSIIGLVSIYFASQPQDDNHHYGHQKFETIATFGISAFIGITSWEVLRHSIARLSGEIQPEFHIFSVGVMLLTMLINYMLSNYELAKSKEYNSFILEADALHTRSDLWVSCSILVSLLGIYLEMYWLDLVVSFGIALFLAKTAFRLLFETAKVLSDAAYIDVAKIGEIGEQMAGVKQTNNIRTRGRPGHAFVDMHLQVDPHMSTQDAHRLAHQVEREIKSQVDGIHEILIHVEPYQSEDVKRGP